MSEQYCDKAITEKVMVWLDEAVIGMGLCPFASRPRERDAIRIAVCRSAAPNEVLEALYLECINLIDRPAGTLETSLLVLADEQFSDFYDFNDFLGLAEGLLERCGWEGEFQLASFHPAYCFADAEESDPANYSNRAPWPILHILREDSVEAAVDSYSDVDAIPERNIARLRAMSGAELSARFPWVEAAK